MVWTPLGGKRIERLRLLVGDADGGFGSGVVVVDVVVEVVGGEGGAPPPPAGGGAGADPDGGGPGGGGAGLLGFTGGVSVLSS